MVIDGFKITVSPIIKGWAVYKLTEREASDVDIGWDEGWACPISWLHGFLANLINIYWPFVQIYFTLCSSEPGCHLDYLVINSRYPGTVFNSPVWQRITQMSGSNNFSRLSSRRNTDEIYNKIYDI